MAGSAPTCVYQNISNLGTGFFSLSYKYSPRDGYGLNLAILGVYWNGKKVDYVVPTNYSTVTRTIPITQVNQNQLAQFKICD
jgi:hypothetical protein